MPERHDRLSCAVEALDERRLIAQVAEQQDGVAVARFEDGPELDGFACAPGAPSTEVTRVGFRDTSSIACCWSAVTVPSELATLCPASLNEALDLDAAPVTSLSFGTFISES